MNRLRALEFLLAAAWLAPLPAPAAQRTEVRPASTALALDALERGQHARWIERVPVAAGERILLSSTLRLFAFDATTGELAWSGGPPLGWETLATTDRQGLFEGLAVEHLFVSPGAGDGIAVAALQVPVARTKPESWQGIPIGKALPERRLFAFELATGRSLWNHAPPADWDGSTGPFPQRMSLIASPLVVGSRVLVPCTSDGSSIDYHVACYQLATGALLWSTFVARGQVERNMFGQRTEEFATAPLTVTADGTRAIAQTDLGRVAALDVATGELRWECRYEPIPLPKSQSYFQPKRIERWRTTPPLVFGAVLLATPRDCAELLVLDLASGRRLGCITETTLQELDPGQHPGQSALALDHLIGAGPDTLYFGGARVLAVTRPGGWRSEAPWQLLWSRSIGSRSSARARLEGGRLFVPDGHGTIHELETGHGRELSTFAAEPAAGVLVTDTALFAVGRDTLQRIER